LLSDWTRPLLRNLADKTITTTGDRAHELGRIAAVTNRAEKDRDGLVQVVLFDDGVRPDGLQQLVLGDDAMAILQQKSRKSRTS
jgi:hypothetical protein